MKLTGIIAFCGLTMCCTLSAQEPGVPVIDKSLLPDASFSPSRSFNGESLYGYIDGGADLYLEYGFEGVTVSEFTLGTGKYKAEIYKMKDPESAFGIFSVSRFRCSSRPAFTAYTCLNRYQLQICKGPYYISIINESGTPADSILSVELGERLSVTLENNEADLRMYFPDNDPNEINNTAIMVEGRLGLMNGAPDLEDFFRDISGYTALILNHKDGMMVSVKFRDASAMEEFTEKHGWRAEEIGERFLQTAGGEMVRVVGENHLLIEIPM